MTVRDGSNRYLQPDWTVSSSSYTFRIEPDVVGAKSTTWSKEITVPTRAPGRPRRALSTRPASPTSTPVTARGS